MRPLSLNLHTLLANPTASRGDSQTTHIFHRPHGQCAYDKKWMGSPQWYVSKYFLMFNAHLRKFLWMYCPGHAEVKGNGWAGSLAGKASITHGLYLGRSEVLRSSRQKKRAKDITSSIDWSREAQREELLDYFPWKDTVNHTNTGTGFQRQPYGNVWEAGRSAYGLFRAHKNILTWTELNRTACLHWPAR